MQLYCYVNICHTNLTKITVVCNTYPVYQYQWDILFSVAFQASSLISGGDAPGSADGNLVKATRVIFFWPWEVPSERTIFLHGQS